MTDEDLLLFWAKLGKVSPCYHPLICHMIDVAAVATALWHDVLPAETRARISLALGIPEVAAGRWVAVLAGLHDLGKASPAFQFRDPRA